jgi:hypothetical protein
MDIVLSRYNDLALRVQLLSSCAAGGMKPGDFVAPILVHDGGYNWVLSSCDGSIGWWHSVHSSIEIFAFIGVTSQLTLAREQRTSNSRVGSASNRTVMRVSAG